MTIWSQCSLPALVVAERNASSASVVTKRSSSCAELGGPFTHLAGSRDISVCAGKTHCVILLGGVDVFQPDIIALSNVNWSKRPKGFGLDAAFWNPWMEAIAHRLDGQVGFILLEARDASSGADELHKTLSQLGADRFAGRVSVVAHSNGASALFLYMARAAHKVYAVVRDTMHTGTSNEPGDVAMKALIAMSMPTQVGLTRWWSGAGITTIAWHAVKDYLLNTGAQGLYASNRRDLIALLPPPHFVPMAHYYVSEDASWDVGGVHTWLVDHAPNEALLRFLLGGTSQEYTDCA